MLDLPADLDARIRDEAARAGVRPDEFVRQVLTAHLQSTRRAAGSVADLFDRWRAREGTADAGEVARRQEEFERFTEAINRSREQTEGPAARKPYP